MQLLQAHHLPDPLTRQKDKRDCIDIEDSGRNEGRDDRSGQSRSGCSSCHRDRGVDSFESRSARRYRSRSRSRSRDGDRGTGVPMAESKMHQNKGKGKGSDRDEDRGRDRYSDRNRGKIRVSTARRRDTESSSSSSRDTSTNSGDAIVHEANVWANLGPVKSSLHFDGDHNLLHVQRGRKTVLLLPPALTPLLAANSLHAASPNHSSLTREEALSLLQPGECQPQDTERENIMNSCASAMQVTVEAGDCIFIPEGECDAC